MAKRPRSPPGEPMTLGNMRANGVRSLDVSCSATGADVWAAHSVHSLRHHSSAVLTDGWPDPPSPDRGRGR
jgi:hypothetical protein